MEIKEYKCPNCSGAVQFDTSVQKMKCPYCDTEFEIESFLEYQKELETPERDNFELDTGKVSTELSEADIGDLTTGSCPSCGAELIGDENTIATVCPCCGNTQIVKQRVTGMLKPEFVLPFQLDKKQATEKLKEFYKEKKLLPDLFKEENRINSIQGLYVPFWLFDANAKGHVIYKATRTSGWSDKNYIYSKTDFYSVTRDGSLDFEKVPVDGSEKMDDDFMDAIEPFDYSRMKDFMPMYLSGFLAEKYDVGIDASKERAFTKMKQSFEDQCRKTVSGYATVIKESSSVNVENGKVSYALFPVWVLNTKYKGTNYQFMMNGQSGKFIGTLPIDKNKAIACFCKYTIGFGIVLTAVIQLLRIFLP